MLSNPVFLSVVLMLVLCVCRFNVFLAILLSAMFAGVYSAIISPNFTGFSEIFDTLNSVLNTFISGMRGNLETSLSYVLVGAIAMAIANTNLTAFLANFIQKNLSNKKFILLFCLALISCTSQNLIPIHIALITILVPPLIPLFNKLQLDRRAIACALTFGITTPYMTTPLGFGLIFQNIIKDELNNSGLAVSLGDISKTVWMLVFIMLFGLVTSIIFYGKKRPYKISENAAKSQEISFGKREFFVLIGLVITILVQIFAKSLVLGALLGLVFMIISGGIKYKKLNLVFSQGFELMGYVAFIMLVAAGFGEVLRQTGGIDEIVKTALAFSDSKFLVIFSMLLVGLLITLGIGSSFGTIPIIATLFTPICIGFGFSTSAIIFIIAAAGAVGDTGSPASEATLGVQAGLNPDNQCEHIKDVCIPTFIFYNIPLVVLGSIFAYYL